MYATGILVMVLPQETLFKVLIQGVVTVSENGIAGLKKSGSRLINNYSIFAHNINYLFHWNKLRGGANFF